MPPPASPCAHPDYDQALKWMLTQAHDAFLELIAPGLTWRGERSPEIPAVARRADLVWEVERPGGARGLLQVELQIRAEDDIGERLGEYGIRLWRRDHLPVRSVVIFLREGKSIPASPFVIPWEENGESLCYHFGVIRLWEIPQERVPASPAYDLWPLASLMAGATAETTIATAEQLVALPASKAERDDLIGLLFGLAGIRTPRDALLRALRRSLMLDELLRESSIIQAFIEEGQARGRAEGKAEGEREMARAALEGRFGPLSQNMLAALAGASETTLRAIVAKVATIGLDEVRAQLGVA